MPPGPGFIISLQIPWLQAPGLQARRRSAHRIPSVRRRPHRSTVQHRQSRMQHHQQTRLLKKMTQRKKPQQAIQQKAPLQKQALQHKQKQNHEC